MRTPNAERYIIFERNVIQIQFSFFAACVRILCANQIIYRQNDGEVDAPHCTAGISLRAGRVAQCTVDYMVMYGNEILAYRLESAVPKKCVCGWKEVREKHEGRNIKREWERKRKIKCHVMTTINDYQRIYQLLVYRTRYMSSIIHWSRKKIALMLCRWNSPRTFVHVCVVFMLAVIIPSTHIHTKSIPVQPPPTLILGIFPLRACCWLSLLARLLCTESGNLRL